MAEGNVKATIQVGVIGVPNANIVSGSEEPGVMWDKEGDTVHLYFHPKETGEPKIIASILAWFGVKAIVDGPHLKLFKTGSWVDWDGRKFHISIPVPDGVLPPIRGLYLLTPGGVLGGWSLGISQGNVIRRGTLGH